MGFQVTVGAELIAIAVMAIIFLRTLLEKDQVAKSTWVFRVLILVALLATVVDFISWIIPPDSNRDLLEYVSLLSIVLSQLVVVPFVYYIYLCIEENNIVSIWYARIVSIFVSVNLIVFIVIAFTGNLFEFDNDGVFIEKPAYRFVGIVPIIVLLYVVVMAVIFRKVLGTANTLSVFLYVFFPITAQIFEIFVLDFEITLASLALSIITIYIFIQSQKANNSALREQILLDLSHKDSLTGMKNRKAFEEAVAFSKDCGAVCVVFCDVNGLKYTNDNFGHSAGDKLLVNFSKIMKLHFGEEDSYRISGDEFVAVFNNRNAEDIKVKLDEFSIDVVSNGNTASFGVADGEGRNVLEVINQAETKMYEAKHAYYNFEGAKYKRTR